MRSATVTADSLHAVERVFGYCLTEDSSAAASVELRAGSATGTVVAGPIHLASDSSKEIVFDKGVFLEFPGGCYVKAASGSFGGQLFY